jgi:hypothetical protein
MVLKTPERKGPLHGYGIARQIEQTSADQFGHVEDVRPLPVNPDSIDNCS